MELTSMFTVLMISDAFLFSLIFLFVEEIHHLLNVYIELTWLC